MKYCEFCGKELPDNEYCNCEEAVAAAEKKEKKTIQIVALVFGAILLVSIVVSLISQAAKVNPLDYTTVTFNGLNGAGTVEVDFDESALIDSIIGEEPDSFEGLAKWAEKYDAYSEGIDYIVKSSDDLSNGDKVEIRFSVVGSASSKVKSVTKTFTVENLPEAEAVDVFKDVEFKITGVNGSAELYIKNNSENEFAKSCRFSADKEDDLKTGDKITITVEYDTEDSVTFNSVPKETVKQITVSGLPSYVTDVSQIPKEKLEPIAQQFLNEEKEDEGDSLVSYDSYNYYKTWFLYPHEDASYIGNIQNKLVFCVSCKKYIWGDYSGTIYTLLQFNNVLVAPDGSFNLDYEDGYCSTFFTDEARAIEEWEEDYTVTEIK